MMFTLFIRNGRFSKQTYHLANHAKLHKACAECKPQSAPYQYRNKRVAPKGITNICDEFSH